MIKSLLEQAMRGKIDIFHFNLKIVKSIIVSSVRYTHHSIQNEVIEIFRQMILGSIRDDIHNVRCFSVMADELVMWEKLNSCQCLFGLFVMVLRGKSSFSLALSLISLLLD